MSKQKEAVHLNTMQVTDKLRSMIFAQAKRIAEMPANELTAEMVPIISLYLQFNIIDQLNYIADTVSHIEDKK